MSESTSHRGSDGSDCIMVQPVQAGQLNIPLADIKEGEGAQLIPHHQQAALRAPSRCRCWLLNPHDCGAAAIPNVPFSDSPILKSRGDHHKTLATISLLN